MPRTPKLKPKIHKWKYIEVLEEYMNQKLLEMEVDGWEVFSISVKTLDYTSSGPSNRYVNIFLRRAWNRRK